MSMRERIHPLRVVVGGDIGEERRGEGEKYKGEDFFFLNMTLIKLGYLFHLFLSYHILADSMMYYDYYNGPFFSSKTWLFYR